MKTAIEIRKTPYGKTVFACLDEKMTSCGFFEPEDLFPPPHSLPPICRHNLDPSEAPDSSSQITDFCFCAKARREARKEFAPFE